MASTRSRAVAVVVERDRDGRAAAQLRHLQERLHLDRLFEVLDRQIARHFAEADAVGERPRLLRAEAKLDAGKRLGEQAQAFRVGAKVNAAL